MCMEVTQRFDPALEEEVIAWKVMTEYKNELVWAPSGIVSPFYSWTKETQFDTWVKSDWGPGWHAFLSLDDAKKPYLVLSKAIIFKVKMRNITAIGNTESRPTIISQEIYIDTKSAIELDGVEEPEFAYQNIT